MSETVLSGGGPTSEPDLVCPWCSAALPSAGAERCPSCGAALKEPDTAAVPGVTQIDVDAILKSRAPVQKPRGLIGWLAGDYEAEAPDAPPPGTFEPPDEAVRREMLRLELAALEAEVLARQAEVVAEVATETGEPVDLEDLGLGDAQPADVDASADADASGDASSEAAETADANASGEAAETADADATAADVATADTKPADADATASADTPDAEDRKG
jgi:hypothetical protein